MIPAEPAPAELPPARESTLFDLLPVGAYRCAADGRLLRANAALVQLNGYAGEADLLAAVHDIGAEWYVQAGRREVFRARLARDGIVRGFISEVYRHRTRERIWVSENAHVVCDAGGDPLYYEGTVEEITERVRAEQALAQRDALLQTLTQHFPGVLYLAQVDTEGRPTFHFISDGVREVYGVEPAAALHDGGILQRMRHPDDWQTVQSELRESERQGVSHTGEFRIVRPDGAVRWVQGTSVLMRRQAVGDLRTGVIVDVTAHRQAEDLRAERDRAEASRRAASALLSRISHELRTPLNAVLGFAQLLERDAGLDARQRQWTSQIVASGRHLLALVDDVLDLSSAQSGEFAPQIGSVDLAEALAASWALLEDAAAAAGLCYTAPPPPLPAVRADPRRLRQVLGNLLSNAVKYNRRGGRVSVTVTRDAGQVRVAVADTGPGLAPADQARLFQPFERLGAPQRAIDGTGLGLALSRQLARAMGGDIELCSTPGEGSCFTLRLPAAD